MTPAEENILTQQALIIRELGTAEDMIDRHERSPNDIVKSFAHHWRNVKRSLIEDYQRISEKWGKA